MRACRLKDVKQFWQEKPGKELAVIFSPLLSNSKNIGVGLVKLRPGADSGEHSHREGVEEFWVVTKGKGILYVGGEPTPMEAGMVLYGEPGKPHKLVNTGNEEFVAVYCITPAGEEKKILDNMVRSANA